MRVDEFRCLFLQREVKPGHSAPMAREVFISHSARDRSVADAVCEALEASGLRCWVAPRNVRPGHSFGGEITRALRQSKVMVLIFSGHSNKSEQVLREVQLATDCHLPIIRFRIEDVALTDDLTYFLSTPHWLDALTPPLSKHIATLELAVRELVGQSPQELADVGVSERARDGESTQKEERETVTKKAFGRGKLMAIAGVLFLAAIGVFVAVTRSGRQAATERLASTPILASPAAQTPQLRASPSLPSPPTAEPSRAAFLPSPAPESSHGGTQPNLAGPAPRNGRSWKAWLDDFVHQYVRSSESNDSEVATSFFGPTVDLFDEGLKQHDFIRRDTALYNARWPTRRATIRGDVRLSEKIPDRAYTATFEADYYVESTARGEWINLAVLVDLQIAVSDGLPRITSLKQKRLRKEEGKMQPRPPAKAENIPNNPVAATTIAPTAMAASSAVAPSAPPTNSAEGNPRLVRVVNTRHGFSALLPPDVFPNPQTPFTADRQIFSSADGQTTLTLFVRVNTSAQSLRESYEQWAAQHTKTEPGKTVDYKILRENWFVVSGEKSGRGFYVKAVAKKDLIAFMYFECDENNYPVSKETLTTMSRAFDGN